MAGPAERWIGETLAGTYRITNVLGEGGMGTVYLAEHTRLPRRFAVKVLNKPQTDAAEWTARFRQEAEVAARLHHRHIVEVVDYNNSPRGQPYIVMELLRGEDLAARLARNRTLELTTALAITRQVASALNVAHKHGVVHRDLKPQNIFLCAQEDRTDYVKVLDFGISKLMNEGGLTGDGKVIGTPWYMAPEQLMGKEGRIDARTDVFALGTVVYEMLAGQRPFVADSVLATLNLIAHEMPPPLPSLNPAVPEALDRVVARALAKQADDRFTGAWEFLVRLIEAAGLDEIPDEGWSSITSRNVALITAPEPEEPQPAVTPSPAATPTDVDVTLPLPEQMIPTGRTSAALPSGEAPVAPQPGGGSTTISGTAAEVVTPAGRRRRRRAIAAGWVVAGAVCVGLLIGALLKRGDDVPAAVQQPRPGADATTVKAAAGEQPPRVPPAKQLRPVPPVQHAVAVDAGQDAGPDRAARRQRRKPHRRQRGRRRARTATKPAPATPAAKPAPALPSPAAEPAPAAPTPAARPAPAAKKPAGKKKTRLPTDWIISKPKIE